MSVGAFVFWAGTALAVYTYLGYPVAIIVWARIRPRRWQRSAVTPSVSLVIAAYNEERVIREKIENSLALDYPPGLLEIIIAADGSTDGTVALAQAYAGRGVRVLHEPGRKGKTSALNRAAAQASGEVLFFSDANTSYDPGVVRTMVRNFADPAVGGVSGQKIIRPHDERDASQGETAYWSYEAALKTAESLAGSIVTADGEIFAMRRALFQAMPPQVVHDDMYLTLRIVEQGSRVVYENAATSAEYASKTLVDEFHLKVRYASAGYQLVGMFRRLFFPPRSLFAVEFLSHKLLRWLAPFFVIAMLVGSAVAAEPLVRLILWLQVAFYGAAAAAWLARGRARSPLLYFPLYFVMGNAAALYGFVRHFRTGQSTQWRRAER